MVLFGMQNRTFDPYSTDSRSHIDSAHNALPSHFRRVQHAENFSPTQWDVAVEEQMKCQEQKRQSKDRCNKVPQSNDCRHKLLRTQSNGFKDALEGMEH
jgi:hypothetical protein